MKTFAICFLIVAALTLTISSCGKKSANFGGKPGPGETSIIEEPDGGKVEPPIVGPENPPGESTPVTFSVITLEGGYESGHGFEVVTEDLEDGGIEILIKTGEIKSRTGAFLELGFDSAEYSFAEAEYLGLLGHDELVLTLSAVHTDGVALAAVRKNYPVTGGHYASGELFRVMLANAADSRTTNKTPNPEINSLATLSLAFDEGEPSLRFKAENFGDFNRDGRVTILDADPIAAAFGAVKGQGLYNALLDFDKSGKVGVLDLAPIVQNFGSELGGYNVYAGNVESTAQANTRIGGNPTITGVKNGDDVVVDLDSSIDYGDYYHVIPVDLAHVEGEGKYVKYDLPFPPRNFSATRTDNGIESDWDAPPQPVYAYNFYYSRVKGASNPVRGNLAPIPPSETQFTYANADPAITYYVKVTAVSDDGRESAPSRELSLTVIEEAWRIELGNFERPSANYFNIDEDGDTISFYVNTATYDNFFVIDTKNGQLRWSDSQVIGSKLIGDKFWVRRGSNFAIQDKYTGAILHTESVTARNVWAIIDGAVLLADNVSKPTVLRKQSNYEVVYQLDSFRNAEYVPVQAGKHWEFDDGYLVYDMTQEFIQIQEDNIVGTRNFQKGVPFAANRNYTWYQVQSVPLRYQLELADLSGGWNVIGSYTEPMLTPLNIFVAEDTVVATARIDMGPVEIFGFERENLSQRYHYTLPIGVGLGIKTPTFPPAADGKFYAYNVYGLTQLDLATGAEERKITGPGRPYLLGVSAGILVVVYADQDTNIYTAIGYRIGGTSPPPPANLTVTQLELAVRMDWNSPEGIDDRCRVRCRKTGGEWIYSDLLPAGVNEYRFSFLNPLSEYEFQVQAAGPGGNYGDWGESAFAVPLQEYTDPKPGDIVWQWDYRAAGFKDQSNRGRTIEAGNLIVSGFDRESDNSYYLAAFGIDGPEPVWEKSFPDTNTQRGFRQMESDDQFIYVTNGENVLYCYNFAGEEQWNKTMPTPGVKAISIFGAGDSYLFVSVPSDGWYTLDKTDGSEVHSGPVPYTDIVQVRGFGDRIIVATMISGNYTCYGLDHEFNELWSIADRHISTRNFEIPWIRNQLDIKQHFLVSTLDGSASATIQYPEFSDYTYMTDTHIVAQINNESIICYILPDYENYWTFTPGAALGKVSNYMWLGNQNLFSYGGSAFHFVVSLADGSEVAKVRINSPHSELLSGAEGHVFVFDATYLYCIKVD